MAIGFYHGQGKNMSKCDKMRVLVYSWLVGQLGRKVSEGGCGSSHIPMAKLGKSPFKVFISRAQIEKGRPKMAAKSHQLLPISEDYRPKIIMIMIKIDNDNATSITRKQKRVAQLLVSSLSLFRLLFWLSSA